MHMPLPGIHCGRYALFERVWCEIGGHGSSIPKGAMLFHAYLGSAERRVGIIVNMSSVG